MKKRGGISDQLKNNSNSINGTWDMQLSMWGEKLDPCPTPQIKINSRWRKDLYVQRKTKTLTNIR